MSAGRRTKRTTRLSSDARIQRAMTREQRLEEVTALKSQAIADQVADRVRKEIAEAVSKELTARGYVQAAEEPCTLNSPLKKALAGPASVGTPIDRGMGPTLPRPTTTGTSTPEKISLKGYWEELEKHASDGSDRQSGAETSDLSGDHPMVPGPRSEGPDGSCPQ